MKLKCWLDNFVHPAINFSHVILCYAMQVMIGTAELKANHSIQQIVEVISDHEKYPRYVLLTSYLVVH